MEIHFFPENIKKNLFKCATHVIFIFYNELIEWLKNLLFVVKSFMELS